MDAKRIFCLLLLILMARAPAPAQQRAKADDTREAFLITRDSYLVSRRKVPVDKSGQPAPGARASRLPQIGDAGGATSASARPIGLGYTLFKKGADGNPVRANPAQEFREGDGVRFMIESNTDGYVYIFHTENDGPPKMIFPDARLKNGDNRIKAHAPFETPSRDEPGDWWFFFDGQAATERFYLVVTRDPLTGVKTGEALVAYCDENPSACPWRPSKAVWDRLLAQAGAAARVSRSREFGAAQTEVEREAVTRGVELRPGAPAPAMVKMSASPKAEALVAQVAIIHK
jgi:hypothetical protein